MDDILTAGLTNKKLIYQAPQNFINTLGTDLVINTQKVQEFSQQLQFLGSTWANSQRSHTRWKQTEVIVNGSSHYGDRD